MRKGLLISTMLVSVAGLGASADVWAQCATTTCSSLGYTSSSNTGDCLKCPFGEAWACPKITCPDNAKYTCSGTGYAGGVGIPCNGKYTECACATGYVWNNGSCTQTVVWGQCTGNAPKYCKVGDALFSDGTCASGHVSGKTAIAVVVYISDEGCAQALALDKIGEYLWGPGDDVVDGLKSYSTFNSASQDFASCKNSKIIMAAGGKSTYPAVWAAHEYSTEGTSAGDWCLPAAGVFDAYRKNKEAVDATLEKLSRGVMMESSFLFTSTQESYRDAWSFATDSGLSGTIKDYPHDVRPVIEF